MAWFRGIGPRTYTNGDRGYFVWPDSDSRVFVRVYALPGDVFLGAVEKVGDAPLPWVTFPADGRIGGRARTRIKAVELLVDRHHGRGD